MFDFDKPEDGSQGRFDQDLAHNPAPADKIKHRGWWLAHNCVAHPLIGLAPYKWTFDFHDWTSRKLHESPVNPEVPR